MKPSAFYQERFWKIGLKAARALPRPFIESLAAGICSTYGRCNGKRRSIVFQNLLPLHDGNASLTRRATSSLFRNFGIKLADLWRFESGVDVVSQIKTTASWERFDALRKDGRGVLLLTPHLGNWEFGAPLLAQRGVKLQVLTQPEPEGKFTELRQKARERWGIQTIVVGADPFAFIEVIRKLEEGAVVALLVDRPPSPTGVEAELFRRPFLTSIAPAELARASGCALVPVVLPRIGAFYEAQLLPEIEYVRPQLGNRQTRAALAQKVMTAFEPVIRKYADQWYHFVPIWPAETLSK